MRSWIGFHFNNFPNYLQSFCEKQEDLNILQELHHRQFFQPKGSPPFSSSMIRFALLLRYTSAAAYRIIQQHLPLPSTSLLEKLRSSKVAIQCSSQNAIHLKIQCSSQNALASMPSSAHLKMDT